MHEFCLWIYIWKLKTLFWKPRILQFARAKDLSLEQTFRTSSSFAVYYRPLERPLGGSSEPFAFCWTARARESWLERRLRPSSTFADRPVRSSDQRYARAARPNSAYFRKAFSVHIFVPILFWAYLGINCESFKSIEPRNNMSDWIREKYEMNPRIDSRVQVLSTELNKIAKP